MVKEKYIQNLIQEAINLMDFSGYVGIEGTDPLVTVTELNFFFDSFHEVDLRLVNYSKNEPVLIMFTPYSRTTSHDNTSNIYSDNNVTVYLLYPFKKGWDVAKKETQIFSWLGDLKNQFIEKMNEVPYLKVDVADEDIMYLFGVFKKQQRIDKIEKAVLDAHDLCGFGLTLDTEIEKEFTNNC
jgi:hypothetical protein